MTLPYARRMNAMRASEIRELLKLVDRPEVISFAGGIPDPALFPAEAARAAFSEALAEPAAALQYGVSEGYLPLREAIAAEMARAGVPATADNILITAGSQQGLDFLAKALLSPGDTVLAEYPTYLGALQAFSAYEPRYDRLRLDGGNMTPAAYLGRAARDGGALKALYLVPDFANPTGLSLPLEARRAALALAEETGGVVIEDAAYRALRFSGPDQPSLQALDVAARGGLENSRVAYLGTFSKTVAPGLRIGWVCAARALIAKLTLINQASALHVSTINQIAMHKLAQGLPLRIAAARSHYRAKRDALLDALERHAPGLAHTIPEGGLFSWATLPQGIDAADLLARSLGEVGVAFVPGAAFHPDGSGANTLRLSYSLPSLERIEEGIWRLARLF